MKRWLILSLLLLCGVTQNAYAVNWKLIVDSLTKIYGVNLDLKQLDQNILDMNKDQLSDINAVMEGLTGTHSYGEMEYDPNQFNWGSRSGKWQDVLSLYQSESHDPLAQVSDHLEKQFPISNNLNQGNPTENAYYLLQAQTTLASRSSSQLAFDQVSKETEIIEHLHHQIDKAKDTKSSTDLNNRLVSEQNAMSIQQTKLLATLVQQWAVAAQEKANHSQENSTFFDYKKGG
jgi:hypothetical protein